jgi:hypothetical protein
LGATRIEGDFIGLVNNPEKTRNTAGRCLGKIVIERLFTVILNRPTDEAAVAAARA